MQITSNNLVIAFRSGGYDKRLSEGRWPHAVASRSDTPA